MSNNELLTVLVSKQLSNVEPKKKLRYSDMKRICKYIKSSIFDENKCCLWSGYVTNANNDQKGTYINFYFKKKKAALHRLLYANFIDKIGTNEYLKFTCDNKGQCCNVMHLRKFKYKKNKDKAKETKKEVKIEKSTINNLLADPNILHVSFD